MLWASTRALPLRGAPRACKQLERLFDASSDSDIPKNVSFTFVINTLLPLLEVCFDEVFGTWGKITLPRGYWCNNFSHLHDEGVIFPPIDEGFLSSVVVGFGRHPAEMNPHRSITPTTVWKGDFALVETNLKLFTSTRRPSQRKSACGSPQHIPNCPKLCT